MASRSTDPRVHWARIAGAVAVFGAVIGMCGDYCLLYSPGGGYMDGDYAFLRGIPNSRLIWGHYLGILGIPLEAAGLYLVWLSLLPMGRRIAMGAVVAGLYIMFSGVAYHGGVYPLADAVRSGNGQMEAFRPFNEPLGLAFAAVFFLLVVVYAWWVGRGKTALPRWMAALSPLVSYGMVMVLYVAVPAVGNFLAPMGFNLGMGLLFGVMAGTASDWMRRVQFS